MKEKKVTLIDYGAGNILSVSRALEACGSKVEITNEIKKIKDASYVVLPGDGAFSFASVTLKKLEIFQALKDYSKKGNPMLGICLGMQLLLSKSEEFGQHDGLSIIKGKIKKIEKQNDLKCKIPIIGWHEIKTTNFKDKKLEKKIKFFNKKKFYFVHSYVAITEKKDELLSYFNFGKLKITAMVGRDNIIGCQFHPEKSGQNGINLINKFLLL